MRQQTSARATEVQGKLSSTSLGPEGEPDLGMTPALLPMSVPGSLQISDFPNSEKGF